MNPRRMLLTLALLIVLGLVAWRLVRGINAAPDAPVTKPVAGSAGQPNAGAPAAPAGQPNAVAAPPVAAGETAPSSPSSARAPGSSGPVATPSSAPLPPGAGSSMRTASGAAGGSAEAAKQEEGLRDRTGGWGQAIIRQLNKELMPLASECIDQAVARDAKLEGTLALDLVVVPVDAKKAIVESVTPSPYNQIKDDELVECIRQSSFAMEGLGAPYNFTLSMPIKPASPAGK